MSQFIFLRNLTINKADIVNIKRTNNAIEISYRTYDPKEESPYTIVCEMIGISESRYEQLLDELKEY